MGLFTLEHGRAVYFADFLFYGSAVIVLAVLLSAAVPHELRFGIGLLAAAGLVSWTLIEYLLHRFVLHGLQPFCRWHGEHHSRPMARICTPTVLSATLIFTLVFLPALLLGSLWRALAFTLGVLFGYLAYSITHHATHHWRANSAWLRNRKRWHALHHHDVDRPTCFGVTSSFWDHVFGSAGGWIAPRSRSAG